MRNSTSPFYLNNMNLKDWLKALNPKQYEAVTAASKYLLVLAGAGSGKTRVLTHHIAWLLHTGRVTSDTILAVTFTNKAANEMRQRVETLMHNASIGSLWIGTFHKIAHRLLRLHWKDADLPEAFQILDADDQWRLIRRIIREMNIDEAKWTPKQVQWYINTLKDSGKRKLDLEANPSVFAKVLQRIITEYEHVCQKNGLCDFAELLLRAYELLQNNSALLDHYRKRFRHILVDEFQDTNTVQYELLRVLGQGQDNHLMIVGDDDQSIYGWRGARVEHMLNFKKDFPGTELIRLEQNYRSTGVILQAANALIRHNQSRLGKNLWTEKVGGELIQYYQAYNDREEARFVAATLSSLLQQQKYRTVDCAILYRSNAQSRLLEEALLKFKIPYRIYGGVRFFERTEIKEALAYLSLLYHPDYDVALMRVINKPARGIGDRTLEILQEKARAQACSLWQVIQQEENNPQVKSRAALLAFIALITAMQKETKNLTFAELVNVVLVRSGLMAFYQQEKGEIGLTRIENLAELINAAKQFEKENHADNQAALLDMFLAYAALESGETETSQKECIQLMTLHAAKGLEFPVVFLVGLEDGLFPHGATFNEASELEEERRLCYVGVTRAKERLFLTYALSRYVHGEERYQSPSRFLQEIPAECLNEMSLPMTIRKPIVASASIEKATPVADFQLGQLVQHAHFGEGVVLALEGTGPKAHIIVQFKKYGKKHLMVGYANLKVIK